MTLSIAACFPWGKLRDVNRSLPPQMRMEEGVILATDSRFRVGTYVPSGRPQNVDTGKKLYPLDSVTALVFAGDVWAAQEAVRFLRRYRGLRRLRPIRTPGGPVNVASFLLRHSYERGVPIKLRDKRPLTAMIGTMTPAGPTVIRFRSPTFKPLYVTGVTAAGWNQDIKAFERQLYGAQDARWQNGDIQMSPDTWHMEAVVAMKAALANTKRSDTIGGYIQSVIITRNGGVRGQNVRWLVEGGNPMEASDYEQLTTPLSRVRGHPLSATAVIPEAGLVFKQVMR